MQNYPLPCFYSPLRQQCYACVHACIVLNIGYKRANPKPPPPSLLFPGWSNKRKRMVMWWGWRLTWVCLEYLTRKQKKRMRKNAMDLVDNFFLRMRRVASFFYSSCNPLAILNANARKNSPSVSLIYYSCLSFSVSSQVIV